MRVKVVFFSAIAAIAVTACAPDNLDITPTATASPTPPPVATTGPDATPEGTAEAAAASAEQVLLDAIVAAVPRRMPTGSVQWQRTDTPVSNQVIQGGSSARLEFGEPGGGQAELSFFVFPTAEAAQEYYDRIRSGSIWVNADTDENFPQPNAFVRGVNQSAILLLTDQNIFVRVDVPRLSTSAGEPLSPLMREALDIVSSVSSAT